MPSARHSCPGRRCARRGPALHRLEAAHQHRRRDALRLGDHVEAVVHAVDQVHVGAAGRAEEHLGARGAPLGGVAGQVVLTDIGLGLDDAPDRRCALLLRAPAPPEQVPGHGQGGTRIEGLGKCTVSGTFPRSDGSIPPDRERHPAPERGDIHRPMAGADCAHAPYRPPLRSPAPALLPSLPHGLRHRRLRRLRRLLPVDAEARAEAAGWCCRCCPPRRATPAPTPPAAPSASTRSSSTWTSCPSSRPAGGDEPARREERGSWTRRARPTASATTWCFPLKGAALRRAFARFEARAGAPKTARAPAFEAVARGAGRAGWRLRALHGALRGPAAPALVGVAGGLRDRQPEALEAERPAARERRVRYHAWLQWVAEQQWKRGPRAGEGARRPAVRRRALHHRPGQRGHLGATRTACAGTRGWACRRMTSPPRARTGACPTSTSPPWRRRTTRWLKCRARPRRPATTTCAGWTTRWATSGSGSATRRRPPGASSRRTRPSHARLGEQHLPPPLRGRGHRRRGPGRHSAVRAGDPRAAGAARATG